MKKRRILSFLLAAALACSSLPITAAANDTPTSEGTTPTDLEVVAGEGGTVVPVDETDGITDSYIRASGGDANTALKYTDNNLVLVYDADKVYKLTLKARITPSDAAANEGASLGLRLNIHGYQYGRDSSDGSDWDKTPLLTGAHCLNYSQVGATLNLTDEWQEFEVIFRPPTAPKVANYFKISLERYTGATTLGFDIDAISLVQYNRLTGEVYSGNLMNNNFAMFASTAFNENRTKPTLTKITKEKFLRADMSTAADTSLYVTDETVLPAGQYSISGNFRLASAGTLTAYANGEAVGTADIGTDWTNAKFTVDLRESTSLADIDFAFDAGNAVLDFNNIAYEMTMAYSDDWTDENGYGISYVDEAGNGAGITEYIHVETDTHNGGGNGSDGFWYKDNDTSYAAGTYRLSFYVRTQSQKNVTRNAALRLMAGGKEITSGYSDSYTFTAASGSNVTRGAEITDEWTYKSYDLSLAASSTLQLRFWTYWDPADNVPFDIAKISFVNLATGEELVDGSGILEKEGTLEPTVESAKKYYRTGDTAHVIADASIGVGKYAVTGYFRLSDIDMSAATASKDVTVSALLNGNTKASDVMTLTSTWQKLSVTIDLPVGADQVKLTIPESVDFYGIQYILKEAYSDVWHGEAEGDIVSIINEENNEAGITEYAQVSNVDTNNGAGAMFTCNSPLSAEKQYKLSVWMRAIPQINIDANAAPGDYRDDGDLDIRIFVDKAQNKDGKAQRLEISNIGNAGPHSSNFFVGNSGGTRAANVTSEWQEYTIIFKPQLDTEELALHFTRHYNGVDDIVPFDIAKVSVTEVATGTELVTNGEWKGYSAGVVNEYPALEYHKSGDIPSISADASDLLADVTLEPGKYVFSGSFRVSEYDHAKVTVNDDNVVTEDNNEIAVTVSLMAGETVAATGEVTVKAAWNECEAIFDIRKPVTLSEIKLDLDSSIDFYGIELVQEEAYEYIDEWTSNGGNIVSVVDETDNAYGITEYIHIGSDNGGDGNEGFYYNDKETSLPAGNYRVSFYIRSGDVTNAVRNPALRFGMSTVNGFTEIKTGYSFTNKNGDTSKLAAEIPEEWTYKSFDIAIDGANSLSLRFWTYWEEADCAPFDIAKLSLINLDTNEEYATNGTLTKEATVVPTIETLGTYFSASADASGENTAIYNAQPDVILEPGRYELSGIFRLGDYDFAGSNQIKLSAFAGGAELSAAGANVTPEWAEVKFTLDIAVEISMADLMLVLDASRPLHFKDISLELIERHVSLSDVDPGFIMTLLALRQYQKKFFTKMDVINEVLDIDTETLGTADSNEYIHVSSLNNNASGAKYSDAEVGLYTGKTYLLTVWMRTQRQINIDANEDAASSGDNDMDVRIFIDGILAGGSRMEISNIAHAGPHSSNFFVGNNGTRGANLNENWQKYTVVFKPQTDTTKLNISFQRHWTGGEDVVPFDIDGLSVVEIDPNTKKPITGENLVKDDFTKWSGYDGSETPALTLETETKYFRAEQGIGMTDKVISDMTVLKPGTYTISAKARLTYFDHAKVKLNASDVFSNFNTETLSAYLGDDRIYTETGKKNVKITSSWTDVEFTFEVKNEIKVGYLKLVLDEKLSVDFKDVMIKEGGRVAPESEREVDKPVDPNKPKPLPAITEGNLIEGALDKDHMPYWTIGDQKLTAKTGSDGVKSLLASNITSNSFGFTYEPGYEIMPGSYHFTGEFRTVNEGETTYARVEIGDAYASRKLNNNWRTIDLYFDVAEPTQISVKLRGGPIKTNIKDYEFRNISLTDVNHQEMSVNLYPAGDFENAESVGEWIFGYGSGKIEQASEGGNKFMRISKRSSSDVPLRLEKSIKLLQGETYVISYDIRASKAGETLRVRSYLAETIGLTTTHSTDTAKILYTVTDEWMHVEHTYKVESGTMDFVFDIKGGPGGDSDNKSFDVDNVSLVRLHPDDIIDPLTLLPTDPTDYNTGSFDDEATAMTNIAMGYGEGKITWSKDEDGNGYLTVSDKSDSHNPLRLSPGFALTAGTKYKISYDIRSTVKGETFNARAFVSKDGSNGLDVGGNGVLYEVTDQWKHIECTFTAPALMEFFLEIKGGPRGEPDNKAFDIDNLKIEIAN